MESSPSTSSAGFVPSSQILRKLAEQTAKMGQPSELPSLKTVRRGGYDPAETRALLLEWQADMQQYAELITFLRSELSTTSGVLAEANRRISSLTESVSNLEEERSAVQLELEYARQGVPVKADTDMARELRDARDEVQALRAALAEKEAAGDNREPSGETERAFAQQALESVREELTGLEREYAELQEVHQQDEREIARLKEERQTGSRAVDADLIQEAILSAQRFAAQLRSEAEVQVTQYLERAEGEMERRREALISLREELTALKQSMADEIRRQVTGIGRALEGFSDETGRILASSAAEDAKLPPPMDAVVMRLDELRDAEMRKSHARSAG